MELELISVMIPCYNSSATLARALASLLLQTHQNWEALVVDDGSTDHPELIVEKFNDLRIRYFRLPTNQGRAVARQVALDKMAGNFLTMLDSDDWLMPEKLAKQLRALKENPNLALVSSSMYLADASSGLAGISRYGSQGLSIYPPLRSPRTLPIAHAPITVRAEIAKSRHYDPELKFSEDLDFFLPILLQFPFGVLAEPLYVYFHQDNRSLKKNRAQWTANRAIFKKFFGSYTLLAFYQTLATYPKSWIAALLKTSLFFPWTKNRGISPSQSHETEAYLAADLRVSALVAARFCDPTGAYSRSKISKP